MPAELTCTALPTRHRLTERSTWTPTLAIPSPFSWPVLVPCALRASAQVNFGEKLRLPPPLVCHTTAATGSRHRTMLELLSRKDVSTTMIYTHVLNRGPFGISSPADTL